MCGVAGIFSTTTVSRIDERIGAMCGAMTHRGPDASGVVTLSHHVAIGHVRLSIIDLNAKSNQPMLDAAGRYYLSFNGEIVNFQKIKKELDYPFVTNSDSEVILAAVATKGLDWFLDRAIGMFAFILYDTFEHTVTLVRDHYGIKPLYYAVVKDTLIVSSDIRSLLSSGLIKARLNFAAIDDYLGYRYVREPFTFFESVMQVPHAHYLQFDRELKMQQMQYYALPPLNFDERYDERELIEELHVRLQQVVQRWSIADVRLGSYLSGGVDSSLLTAMLATDNKKLDTYTIGFPDEATNEFAYAQIVADRYGTTHRAFTIDMAQYDRQWDRLIQYKGAPLGVPNEIPLAIMTSRLSEDVTVVMSGEGADELFGGYGRIFRHADDFRNGHCGDDFYASFIAKYEYVPRSFRDRFLRYSCLEHRESYDRKIRLAFQDCRNEENTFRFFHHYHVQGLLQRLDVCTMQASVEARPPFLDRELIDFVYAQIPFSLKIKWHSAEAAQQAATLTSNDYSEKLDMPKYILKKVAERYLPEEVVYRKKMGFPVPLNSNFAHMAELGKPLLARSEWLNIPDIDAFMRQLRGSEQTLWMLLNVEKFVRTYLDQDWRYGH